MSEDGEGITAVMVPEGTLDEAGVVALANLSDAEFQNRLAVLKQGRERVAEIKTSLMVQGEDYGLIPGTGNKPTLLKPGAEKLAEFYRLAAEMLVTERHGDGIVAPLICYVVECRLHLGHTGGPVVATGWGVCSNWERKYRYRGKQENIDPYEQQNTILKMAEKRAFVDAVLRATASSSLFTQDLEDLYADPQPQQGTAPEAQAQAPQRPAQRPTAESRGASASDGFCPVHNREWKRNSRGFYCSGKMPDGDWCNEKPPRAYVAAQELA